MTRISNTNTDNKNSIVMAAGIVSTIAAAFIILSSLEHQERVLHFIAIGIMKIRLVNLEDIDIAFAFVDRETSIHTANSILET